MLGLGLLAGAALCLLIGFFPFGPYQATLLIARKLGTDAKSQQAQSEANENSQSVAVCMCAYNEVASVGQKLENLLELQKRSAADVELLVYVDGADDGTAELVASYGDQITAVISPAREGKTYGMNRLVAMSNAPILVFTDATVEVPLDAIDRLCHHLEEPTVGCVTAGIRASNMASSSTAGIGSSYWSFDEWTKQLESDTGSTMGAYGSLFAVARKAYAPVPDDLIDDLYLPLQALCEGYRVVHAPDVTAVKPHTTSAGDEFQRKQRISQQCIHVHNKLWPQLRHLSGWNVYKYVAHRLVRWYAGYFLLAAAALLIGSAVALVGPGVTAIAAVVTLAVYSLGTRFGLKPFPQLNNVLLAFVGNTIGTWKAMFSEQEATWEVASSVRSDAQAPKPNGPSGTIGTP